MKKAALANIVFLLIAGCLSTGVLAQIPENAGSPNKKRLPTLFIIGDSTVNNSSEGFQGWGNVIDEYFDKSKINVENRARGGRSSRTFYTEGLWDQVSTVLKPGDFVLIQFGHNDGGSLDKERARGSLKGIGDETADVTIEATGKKETVHTYGWYMSKFIADAKTKGVTPIVLSPVPRNIWKESKVERMSDNYGGWAATIAKRENAYFVDLNKIVAERYEEEGESTVGTKYFTPKDHTHTSPAGARLNAELVVYGLTSFKKNPLKKFLISRKVLSSK
jgi:rhamnogalacturonan acetylesterase